MTEDGRRILLCERFICPLSSVLRRQLAVRAIELNSRGRMKL